MSEFNFKSQVCTDRIQSERLLALGLKKETADMVWTHAYYGTWVVTASENPLYEESDNVPAWSLGRLIEMLPSPIHPKEELPSFNDCAYLNLAQIAVWYDYTDYDMDDRTLINWSGNGFFSAVVGAIDWLIKEGFLTRSFWYDTKRRNSKGIYLSVSNHR